MSLYIHIAINNQVIRTFGAQNITQKNAYGEPIPNAYGECDYRVCKYVDNGDGTTRREFLKGNVFHRREDGAVVLSKKVLEHAITWGEL